MNKIIFKNVVWQEGKQYVAWNLNTGVSSFGKTRRKAIKAFREALELYFGDVPISHIAEVKRPDVVPIYGKT